MQIDKKLITSNNKGKAGQNHPRFIVLHDTGNAKPTADAKNHYNWLQNTANTNASAHVFIDDHQAIQVIDYNTPAWHTGKLYVSKPQAPECSNFNSIGIEFCINAGSNLTQTLSNTLEVTKALMEQFNIPISHVITHQMSSGKACPGTFVKQPELYQKFMQDLKAAFKPNPEIEEALAYLVQEHVMTSPDYWRIKIKEIEYLDGLICNTYRALKNAKEGK